MMNTEQLVRVLTEEFDGATAMLVYTFLRLMNIRDHGVINGDETIRDVVMQLARFMKVPDAQLTQALRRADQLGARETVH